MIPIFPPIIIINIYLNLKNYNKYFYFNKYYFFNNNNNLPEN